MAAQILIFSSHLSMHPFIFTWSLPLIHSPSKPINHPPTYSFIQPSICKNLPSIPLHLPYIISLTSSFVSHHHHHPTIHQSICQPRPCTWYLPAVARPAQGGGRLAARHNAAELRLAAFHGLLLHLHRGRLWGDQNRERRDMVVRGICVELAEVAAFIRHADVGQCDAHQPWREEHHLEAVVLQGCGVEGRIRKQSDGEKCSC